MDESRHEPFSSKPHSSSRVISGALAYLSMHLESSCPRSAYLAALLLNHIAGDQENDEQLRLQAQKLAETIENAETPYSIYKSLVTRRRAADSAVARQGEVDKVTDDLEMELRTSLPRSSHIHWNTHHPRTESES